MRVGLIVKIRTRILGSVDDQIGWAWRDTNITDGGFVMLLSYELLCNTKPQESLNPILVMTSGEPIILVSKLSGTY